jgi:sugar phosphate isomerase/epimerase
MHPRLTILSRFHEPTASLDDELEQLHSAGAQRAGLRAARLLEAGAQAAAASLERSGVTVTHLALGGILPLGEPTRLPAAQDAARQSVDVARAVAAPSVYGPTGGAPALDWDDAAAAFLSGIEPVAAHARSEGVSVLIEPTAPLFADISMLTTLSDTVELAERAGIGVCIDVQHCWRERGLRDAIDRAVPIAGLVQISDWVPGRREQFRAIPGDGAIPLERILTWILVAGYRGMIDLEVTLDPDVPPRETISRAIDRGNDLLAGLGV